MTDDRQETAPERDDLPEARSIRSRWPGLVWAIPLAALIIVAYLGVRALTRHGVDVTVTFGYAEGITPGNTKVLVSGVEAGEVSKVRVTPDGHRVEVTLRLDPREKAALNSNTKFWLIGENPTITDIQSIRAAVAGVIIAMAPGKGGESTRSFVGLDQPPIIPPDAKGTPYFLTAPAVGSLQPGASVSYHGLAIGKIVQTEMLGLDQFRMEVFVNAPYDRFVKQGAEFWTGSPLKLSLSGASLSAGLSSPASLLQGSVQFEVPHRAWTAPQAAAGTSFMLYDDQSSAEQGPTGPEIPYRLILTGAAGDLSSMSTVSMLGYTVGRIRSAKLMFAPGGKPYTEAVLAIFPRKLDIDLAKDAPADEWREAADRAVSRLLAQGYRAHMVQSPPLVGAHVIQLVADPGTGPAALGHDGGQYPLIPVAEGGGGADDLISSANQIMAKVNRIPLEQIGKQSQQAERQSRADQRLRPGPRQHRASRWHAEAARCDTDAGQTAGRPADGEAQPDCGRAARHRGGGANDAVGRGRGAGSQHPRHAAAARRDVAFDPLIDRLSRAPSRGADPRQGEGEMMRALSLVGLAALAGLAGCTSPKTTLLTLDAAPPSADAVHADYRGLPIAVPAVHLPAELDRAEFAHQLSAGEVKVDDFARWTAPLGLLARDALVRDLTARLPSGAVLPPGSVGAAGHVRTLDVTILSFQADAGGATLQAAYRTVPGGAVRQVTLTAPATGIAPVPTAQAFATLIGELADRIASDMAGQ